LPALRGAAPPAEETPSANGDVASTDQDAMLTMLYRTETPRLIRLLARRTRSVDEAEDLVQDAFVRFTKSSRTGPALDRPIAYLRRIAANLLKDRSKISSRRSVSLHVVADEALLAGPDQQALLEARDMLQTLEAAMKRLRPRTREIFVAHRVEGLTYAEIAERTGLTVKGVEKQMSKALVQLDRHLSRS
jgi:RNA polymerase sigma-70 factor (ECF subfamily)